MVYEAPRKTPRWSEQLLAMQEVKRPEPRESVVTRVDELITRETPKK